MNNENIKIWIDSINKELDMVYDLFKIETTSRRKKELFLIIFCFLAIFYSNPITGTNINKLIEIKILSLSMDITDAFFIFPLIICFTYILLISTARNEAILIGKIQYYQEAIRYYRRNNIIPKIKDISYTIDTLTTSFLPSSISTKYIISLEHTKPKAKGYDIIIGLTYSIIPFITIILIGLRGNELGNNAIVLMCFFTFILMIFTLSRSGSKSESTTFNSEII